MSLSRLFRRILPTSTLTSNRNPRSKKLGHYKLDLERLEDRTVPTVTILNNGGSGYAGLSFNQSGGYVPPDTNGAAGPNVYVETVNQSLAIYNPKATGASATTDSLSHFFFTTGGLTRADAGSGLSDPVVAYDELIGRFIVGDQDVNFNTHVSAFDLAVSKTNNPTTLTTADWNFYKLTTTETGFDADYPGNFGYNADAFVFTLNMFGVTGGGHLQIVSVKASDLMNGVASPQVARNDLNDFSVRPTTMHGSVAGDPMWLVTEHGDGLTVDVIRMTNVLGAASFAYTNLAVTPYSGVVAPRNPNNTTITTNIDSRIQKSAEANNIIVATHSVSVSATQDVAQWYAFDVSSGTPTLAQQGRINAGPNTYVVYPAIDINSSGQIGMTYMKAGTDTSTDYMSMWVTGRNPADASGTMQTAVKVPAGSGVANYDDFTSAGRAGDLSGINVDPVDGTFWAVNEFANTQATANWGTAIANFSPNAPPPTSADLSVVKTGPSSVTAGTNASYIITLTNNGPDAAQTVVLTDLLPTGSTFVSITPSGTNPDSFTFGSGSGTVTESAASVGAGNTDSFTLVVFAPASLANGANFSNTASATTSSTDPNSANNSSTVTGSIVNTGPIADLSVTNSGPSNGVEGGNLTYTIVVTNNGPDTATGAVLTDTLGANLRFVSATTTQGTFSQSGSVVTFNIGSMANGATVTATVTAQSTEEGNLSNSATVASSSADPTSTNNSATANTVVSEPPIVVSGPITTTARKPSNIVVATFTHANGVEPASAFSATINWGDGKTSTGSITQSGATYTVRGSHNYRSSGSHTITTTVTEIGNAAELLLEKIGDEEPETPPQLGHFHDHGRFALNSTVGRSNAEFFAALLGQRGGNQLTYLPGGGIETGTGARVDQAALDALFAAVKTQPLGTDLTDVLGRLYAKGGINHDALDVFFSLFHL